MILAKKEGFVANKNSLSKMKVIASMMNLDSTIEIIETILKAKKKLYFNVNSTAVVDDVLFKLAEVKVKCRRL